MDRRISVRAIVLHDGKLLCVKLKPYKGAVSGAKDYWCLPGGGLDPRESLVDGVRREMVEETGIEPVVGNLLYMQQFDYDGREYLEFFFHVTNAVDYLDIDLSKSSHGLEEIAEIGFITPAEHNVKPLLLREVDLAADAAIGHTRFFNYL